MKTVNVIEAISKSTGLPRAAVDEVLEGVKKNILALKSCSRPHDFQPEKPGLFSKHRCTKCGGRLGAVEAGWYNKGFEDGSKV